MIRQPYTPYREPVAMRNATVTSVNPSGTVSLSIDGGTMQRVPVLGPIPGIGTTVRVLTTSYSAVVLGATDGAHAQITNDWDDATIPGAWYGAAGIANAPADVPYPMGGTTLVTPAGLRQSLHVISAAGAAAEYLRGEWTRTSVDGVAWTSWRQSNSLAGVVTFNGSGGNDVANVAVPIPAGYFQSTPRYFIDTVITASGIVLATSCTGSTLVGFVARMTNAGSGFSGSYNTAWFAQE